MTRWQEALEVAREQLAWCRAHGHHSNYPSARQLLIELGYKPTRRREDERLYEMWFAVAWLSLQAESRRAA